MTERVRQELGGDVDELGPVDSIVVEFPGSKFRGEIAPALDDLVGRGTVRVLDPLLLKADADGSLEAFELADLDKSEIGELRSYESEPAMLLSEEDAVVAHGVRRRSDRREDRRDRRR